jgi:hypothetical protein
MVFELMDDYERDKLLIRLDERSEATEKAINKINIGLYGDDGQGGVCARVSKLENFQSTILAFVATLTIAISLTGNWVIGKLTGGGN